MQGRVGDCDVMLFEYSYTTGSGKSQHTTQLTAVILFDGAAGVPDFQLAPKTFIDKVVGLFSHNTVEIEDAGEFSRRCKLTGPDEAALRETFHPDLVQHLGKDGRWFIEVADGQMLALPANPAVAGEVPRPGDRRPGGPRPFARRRIGRPAERIAARPLPFAPDRVTMHSEPLAPEETPP